MDPIEARTTLLVQHERIRGLLRTCTRLAKLHRDGRAVAAELDEVLAQLYDEIAAHNRTEIGIIADLVNGPASWGSQPIDEMLREQMAAHTAFLAVVSATPAEEIQRILDLAEEFDAHMADEERTFLKMPTSRQDMIGMSRLARRRKLAS
jgi:iron-sulfur cluster repair protein YtfE (RIC family)